MRKRNLLLFLIPLIFAGYFILKEEPEVVTGMKIGKYQKADLITILKKDGSQNFNVKASTLPTIDVSLSCLNSNNKESSYALRGGFELIIESLLEDVNQCFGEGISIEKVEIHQPPKSGIRQFFSSNK
jgi:hypothetical protein